MRTKVIKFFADYTKEEDWLNNMAARGWNLVAVSPPSYTFEESQPGEYTYRITLLEHTAQHPDTIDHIRMMEDTGVEHVTTYWRWVYYRKKDPHGNFQIYTDMESQIAFYNRMAKLIAWFAAGLMLGVAMQLPGIIMIFTRSSWWGVINVVTVVILLVELRWIVKPMFRFIRRIREMRYEQGIFE